MKAQKILKSIAVMTLSIFLIVYTLIQLITTFSADVEYEQAVQASVEEKIELDSYIVRNEKVLTSGTEGVVYYTVDEGAKVSSGSVVAQIYESDSQRKVRDEIKAIDNKLKILTESSVDMNYATGDISKLDEKIADDICELKGNITRNNLSLAIQKRYDLLTKLNRRTLLTNSTDSYKAQIDDLTAKKASLTKSGNAVRESIVTETSGFFSADIDGYEDAFTVDSIEDMTVESFNKMLSAKKKENKKAVGKVITDFNWYAICPADKYSAAELEVGNTYDLRFPFSSDSKFSSKLYKKITSGESDKVLLVFLTNNLPVNFNYIRKQTVEVIKKDYTGLRVLKTALRKIGDYEGVYVIQGNTVAFKRIEKLYENEGYYIVKIMSTQDKDYASYISMFDQIITKGKNLYEGKIIE